MKIILQNNDTRLKLTVESLDWGITENDLQSSPLKYYTIKTTGSGNQRLGDQGHSMADTSKSLSEYVTLGLIGLVPTPKIVKFFCMKDTFSNQHAIRIDFYFTQSTRLIISPHPAAIFHCDICFCSSKCHILNLQSQKKESLAQHIKEPTHQRKH